MSNPIESRSVVVKNKHGLHMRPARLIAEAAAKFQSDIELIKTDGNKIDAKSMMLIMTLGASVGTALQVNASGSDANEAANVVAEMLTREFDQTDSTDNQTEPSDSV